MMCVAYYCYIIPQDKENTVSPMQVNYSLFIQLTQLRPGPWVANDDCKSSKTLEKRGNARRFAKLNELSHGRHMCLRNYKD